MKERKQGNRMKRLGKKKRGYSQTVWQTRGLSLFNGEDEGKGMGLFNGESERKGSTVVR